MRLFDFKLLLPGPFWSIFACPKDLELILKRSFAFSVTLKHFLLVLRISAALRPILKRFCLSFRLPIPFWSIFLQIPVSNPILKHFLLGSLLWDPFIDIFACPVPPCFFQAYLKAFLAWQKRFLLVLRFSTALKPILKCLFACSAALRTILEHF